jgi:hypothetical protein
MWCLLIVTAHPDHKRPYSNARVSFFATKEEAEQRAMGMREAWLKEFDEYNLQELPTSQDFGDHELFSEWRKGKDEEEVMDAAESIVYMDSHMFQPAFDTEVLECIPPQ